MYIVAPCNISVFAMCVYFTLTCEDVQFIDQLMYARNMALKPVVFKAVDVFKLVHKTSVHL